MRSGRSDTRNHRGNRVFNEYITRLFFRLQLWVYKLISSQRSVIWATHSAYNVPRVMERLSKNVESPLLVGGTKLKGLRLLKSFFLRKNFEFYSFPPPPPRKALDIFLASYDSAVAKVIDAMNSKKNVFNFGNQYGRIIFAISQKRIEESN